jgi:predicted P-loop ATPase
MAFVAVYDANVLYTNTLRDLLIRIAQLPHLVQVKWTEEILEEVAVALRKNLPDITAEKTDRLRERMNAAKSPDGFVRDQIDIDRQAVWACVQQIVDSRTRNPVTIEDVLKQLERDGLVGSVTVLRMT